MYRRDGGGSFLDDSLFFLDDEHREVFGSSPSQVLAFTVFNVLANFVLMGMFGMNYLYDYDWECFKGDGDEEYKLGHTGSG